MPQYVDYICAGNGVALYNATTSTWDFCPTKVAAEQKLLASIHRWSGVDTDQSRREMELLTALIRAV